MVLKRAKKVFEIEAQAVLALGDRLNEDFVQAVNIVLSCSGKVIVSGMGKSGLVSQKIASTLACSGTPAFFLHPAEGVHGDLGMVARGDVFVAVSNSGETEELLRILPVVKRLGLPCIVLTGNTESTLARAGDVVLDVGVAEEACTLGLVPTASAATTMAMGDALAVAVLERRGFAESDFARLHPGGSLGRKLLLRVEDLMHVHDAIPMVYEDDTIQVVLIEMTSKRLGVTGVSTRDGRFAGVITDGDMRRALERGSELFTLLAGDIMSRSPKTIERTELAAAGLQVMEEFQITSLFVIEAHDPLQVVGVIHLHDLLKAGVA